MRVELSNGQSAELREEWQRGDRRAVHKVVSFKVDADGARTVTMLMEDLALEALLTRRITGWTLPQPIPMQLVNPADAYDMLSDTDGEALTDAVRPQYEHIMGIKGDGNELESGPKAKDSSPQTISGTVLSTGTSDASTPQPAASSPVPSLPNSMSGIGSPPPSAGPLIK